MMSWQRLTTHQTLLSLAGVAAFGLTCLAIGLIVMAVD